MVCGNRIAGAAYGFMIRRDDEKPTSEPRLAKYRVISTHQGRKFNRFLGHLSCRAPAVIVANTIV